MSETGHFGLRECVLVLAGVLATPACVPRSSVSQTPMKSTAMQQTEIERGDFVAVLPRRTCAPQVTVIVRAPDSRAFTTELTTVQELISDVSEQITPKCPALQTMAVAGQVSGKIVYRSYAEKSGGWRLVDPTQTQAAVRAKAKSDASAGMWAHIGAIRGRYLSRACDLTKQDLRNWQQEEHAEFTAAGESWQTLPQFSDGDIEAKQKAAATQCCIKQNGPLTDEEAFIAASSSFPVNITMDDLPVRTRMEELKRMVCREDFRRSASQTLNGSDRVAREKLEATILENFGPETLARYKKY